MASIDWNAKIAAYLKATGSAAPAGQGDLFAALGAACQSGIEGKIGRTFDLQSYIEVYSGNGKTRLFLKHDPIWTVSYVTVNGATQDIQTSFTATPTFPMPTVAIDPGQSALTLTLGDVWDDSQGFNVIVSYSAGLTPPGGAPPDDLVFAATYWAAKLYRDRDRVGLNSSGLGAQTATITRDVPTDVLRMIARFRRAFLPS